MPVFDRKDDPEPIDGDKGGRLIHIVQRCDVDGGNRKCGQHRAEIFEYLVRPFLLRDRPIAVSWRFRDRGRSAAHRWLGVPVALARRGGLAATGRPKGRFFASRCKAVRRRKKRPGAVAPTGDPGQNSHERGREGRSGRQDGRNDAPGKARESAIRAIATIAHYGGAPEPARMAGAGCGPCPAHSRQCQPEHRRGHKADLAFDRSRQMTRVDAVSPDANPFVGN